MQQGLSLICIRLYNPFKSPATQKKMLHQSLQYCAEFCRFHRSCYLSVSVFDVSFINPSVILCITRSTLSLASQFSLQIWYIRGVIFCINRFSRDTGCFHLKYFSLSPLNITWFYMEEVRVPYNNKTWRSSNQGLEAFKPNNEYGVVLFLIRQQII